MTIYENDKTSFKSRCWLTNTNKLNFINSTQNWIKQMRMNGLPNWCSLQLQIYNSHPKNKFTVDDINNTKEKLIETLKRDRGRVWERERDRWNEGGRESNRNDRTPHSMTIHCYALYCYALNEKHLNGII